MSNITEEYLQTYEEESEEEL